MSGSGEEGERAPAVSRPRPSPVRLEAAALGALSLLLLVALGSALLRRGLDYDEVEHVHAAWLVAQGRVPFRDFFECHPPFLWTLLAPWVASASPACQALPGLRALALGGNLALLGLLLAHQRLSHPELPWRWPLLAVLLAAPAAVIWLVEARIDAWPQALTLAALLLLRARRPARLGLLARYALGAALATLGTLAAPKLVLLLVAWCAWDLLRRRSGPRAELLRVLAGHALGIAAGLLLAWLWLRGAGVDPGLAWTLVIDYHRRLNGGPGAGFGLAGAVFQRWPLALAIAAGGAAWAASPARRRARETGGLEPAALVFLTAQLLLVWPPHKQYYAPWLLIGAGLFLPHALALLAARAPGRAGVALTPALLLLGALGLEGERREVAGGPLPQQLAALEQLEALARGGPVVGQPPMHPVGASDVHYAWVRSIGPGGRDSEAILRQMSLPGVSERFTPAAYEAELEASLPTLVVDFPGALGLSDDQRRALRRFLAAHREDYRPVPGLPGVLVRR